VSIVERQAELSLPAVATGRRKKGRGFADTWWRHVIALIGVVIALFPVAYIVSAAFNGDSSLSGSSLIPRKLTLDNFRSLFGVQQHTTGHATFQNAHYLSWFGNSMIVAGATALLTVLLSALAAYAFSRFRFRGRRMGMLTLLLIQMFPQLLAVVAIYLIVLNTGDVFHFIGLNTLLALIVVYLGGAMGVNTWLMKGFFDTIPSELDESARVDGATPAQVFWGVVLPLAAAGAELDDADEVGVIHLGKPAPLLGQRRVDAVVIGKAAVDGGAGARPNARIRADAGLSE